MSILTGALGFIAGAIVVLVAIVQVMRSKMLVAHPSQYSFEKTEERIKEAIPAVAGWGMPLADLPISDVLASKGFPLTEIKQGKVLFVCNPSYAREVITARPQMMGMMPCSWALYETREGQVFVAGLNIPLMSKIFSGTVGRVMGQVGTDEAKILKALN